MSINKILILAVVLLWSGIVLAQFNETFASEVSVQKVDFDTGIPFDIWGKELNIPVAVQQVKMLADVELNEEERYWLRQILLTDMKAGKSLNEENGDFLEAAVATLLAQGLFDDALRLVQKTDQKTEKTNQCLATILFAKGDTEKACTDDMMAAFGDEEAFVRVACAVALKTPDEVMLAYDVYQEKNRSQHPFLKAATDARYLDKFDPLPNGLPNFWEAPVLAAERPDDIFKLPLNRGLLMEIERHESLPIGTRDQAAIRLKTETKMAVDGVEMLRRLKNLAEARHEWDVVQP